MSSKPITVARNDYMQALCDISNNSGLPAFVMMEVVERLKMQLERLAQAELERDTKAFNEQSKMEKEDKHEPVSDGVGHIKVMKEIPVDKPATGVPDQKKS